MIRRCSLLFFSLLKHKPLSRPLCYRTLAFSSVPQNPFNNTLLWNTSRPLINLLSLRIRCKSKTSSETDDWSEDPTLDKDSKVVKVSLTSTRLDIVLKAALSTTRNKIEKIFYDSKIRLNGRKVMKKSVQVHEGDEIDVIKSISPKNPDHIIVSRVEIMKLSADEENIYLTARRFKSLLIENYEEHPYKASSSED